MENKDDLLQDILSRFSQLQAIRQKFEPDWTEAQEFVDNSILNFSTPGMVPTRPKRYSSQPCNYLKTLTAGIVGYSISPNIVWFKLSLENDNLLNLYGVKDWLEKTEKVMFAEFNRSNIYKQATPFVKDAAVIGHSVMYADEDIKNNRLRFLKMPANEMYVDANEYGEIDTVFRRFKMTIRNMVSQFGLDALDETIKDRYQDVKNWNEEIEVIHAVFPREGWSETSNESKDKPFASFYIDSSNNKIIEESGYDDMPYIVFQWEPYAGYTYGTSPAQDAVTDVRGLNIAKRTSLQIAQTSAEPPMKVSEDIRKVDITPRGMTYLTASDQIIEPIRTGENYPITLQVTQQMMQDIKDWFMVDFFLMLQSKQGNMTATEVMELQGEKAATLSSLIVNLNDALSAIIARSFNILLRQGKIPAIPQTLAGQRASMKVDFVGPLSQAQKKYHSMGGTAQAIQLAGPIMQLFPNAADYIDGDALMKSTLDAQGMPQSVIREDEDVKKIREQRAVAEMQAQQQAQQQEMINSLMQNANKLNEPVNQGSVLADMNNQLRGA